MRAEECIQEHHASTQVRGASQSEHTQVTGPGWGGHTTIPPKTHRTSFHLYQPPTGGHHSGFQQQRLCLSIYTFYEWSHTGHDLLCLNEHYVCEIHPDFSWLFTYCFPSVRVYRSCPLCTDGHWDCFQPGPSQEVLL